jgi:hypothetical protein
MKKKGFVLKENKDLWHVLYAEETKSRQFSKKKEALKFLKGL